MDDHNAPKSSQKHTKKDYEQLKSVNLFSIINNASIEPLKRKHGPDEESKKLDNVVKIDKKKAFKKNTKKQKKRDVEIQQLLNKPEEIDYDKAMQIYDD